jgi:hypothetical protein
LRRAPRSASGAALGVGGSVWGRLGGHAARCSRRGGQPCCSAPWSGRWASPAIRRQDGAAASTCPGFCSRSALTAAGTSAGDFGSRDGAGALKMARFHDWEAQGQRAGARAACPACRQLVTIMAPVNVKKQLCAAAARVCTGPARRGTASLLVCRCLPLVFAANLPAVHILMLARLVPAAAPTPSKPPAPRIERSAPRPPRDHRRVELAGATPIRRRALPARIATMASGQQHAQEEGQQDGCRRVLSVQVPSLPAVRQPPWHLRAGRLTRPAPPRPAVARGQRLRGQQGGGAAAAAAGL